MKKTIKAWAILLDGELAHYTDGKDYTFAMTKKRAWLHLEKENGYQVIPCTISYELPTP